MADKLSENLKISIKRNPVIAISIFVIILSVGCFGAYAVINNMQEKVYLEKTYISITGWRITHLLLHMLIGFLLPNYLIVSIVIGVTWELIEFTLARTNCWWGTPRDNIEDLFTNTAGFAIGYALNRAIIK